MSSSLWIGSINIEKNYAKLRDPRNPRHPSFPNYGILWAINNRDKDPFTVALKQPSKLLVHMVFQGEIRNNLRGKTAQLTGSTDSIGNAVRFSSGTVKIGENVAHDTLAHYTEDIPVSIHGPSSEVPWGMSCDINWELVLDGEKFAISVPTKLTIYALTDDLPKYLHYEGIPVEFLEMMVKPTIERNIKTKKEWIEFVVWRCFASRLDEFLKNSTDPTLQQRYKDAVHSYRYNSFVGGQPNFTYGTEGGTFDLDRWLVNCNPPGKDQWYATNCYDMSALVQTALRLGLPYHYRNEKGETVPDKNNDVDGKLLTVNRAFRAPFGYIPPTDLVGWGWSNSPFFENEKAKLLEGDQDSERSKFGNHGWVRVRLSETNPKEQYAVDACAGPVAKPKLMSDYLTTAVDVKASKANVKKDWRFKDFNPEKDPSETVGVRSILRDKPAVYWEKTTFMGTSALRLRCIGLINKKYKDPMLLIENTGPTEETVAVEDVIDETLQPIHVPLEGLLRKAFASAVESLGFEEPADTDIHLNESKTFEYGPFTVRTPEPSITSDGTILHFDIWTATSGSPFLSITTMALTDCKQALEYLITHLNTFTHDVDAIWNIPQQDIADGKIMLLPKENLAVGVGAIIRSNVLVTMSGNAGKTTMDKVLHDMADFMDNCFANPVTKVDVSQVTWKQEPEHTVGGEDFFLKFTAPNVVDMSVMSTTKGICIEQDPVHQVGTNDWTVNCFAVPEEDDSQMTVVAAFAAKDSYYTTTKNMTISKGLDWNN